MSQTDWSAFGEIAAGNLEQFEGNEGAAQAPAQPGADASGSQGAQAPQSKGAFSSLDADMRTYAENKGWHKDQNPVGAVLKSYRELESRLGNAVPLPAEGDAQAWEKLYTKLGRPSRAEGYQLPLADGSDLTVQARSMFHAANLTQAQAKAVCEGYMRMVEPIARQQEEETIQRTAEAAEAVREIGSSRMAAAQTVFKRLLGDDPETSQVMERLMGDGKMIRFFDKLADIAKEDNKGALGIGRTGTGLGGAYSVRDLVDEALNKKGGPTRR